jgi:ribosome-associated protein
VRKPKQMPVANGPEHRKVETVNDLHLSYESGPGQGARDSGTEREGPLSTAAISRAGRRRSPAIVSKARPDADETLRIVLARLDDMKAEDTTTIDLRNESAITDYMVVTTGRSNRHVGSVADRVIDDLREAGLTGVRVEGMPNCDWVLIDAGDVTVHVFRPEVRAFYGLEKMWARGRTDSRRAS